MSVTGATGWPEANQRYLMAALGVVREALERHAAKAQGLPEAQESPSLATQRLRDAASAMPSPPALDRLCQLFSLSPFERDVLMICVGVELDASFSVLCASAQGNRANGPTFSLALAALPDAHWSALTPAAPLRRWRLIEVGTGSSLMLSPLRADERVLHYLAGIQHLDERLTGIVEPMQTAGDPVPSQQAVADRIAALWSGAVEKGALPAIQLCGADMTSARTIAMTTCASLGLGLHVMSAHGIPVGPGELEGLLCLWGREAILSRSALLLECDEIDETDHPRDRAITRFVEATQGALILATREQRRERQRAFITFEVHKPTVHEQRALWYGVLGDQAARLDGEIDSLVAQFSLSAQSIHFAGLEALRRHVGSPPKTQEPGDISTAVWDACRAHSRPRMESLAQKIEPAARWADLVLPEPQRQILRDIAAHVRQRTRVYDQWGFRSRGARGLGISALFAGSSGTGKTMAAEVLADELRLDLYRVDLSQVVSKYIGETEKNLRRVFDTAEEGGAILLFDEADALFGKRSEVKDSHDRYANIEVSYLLQRMESYRGLAILTTNMKSALDTAFLRRIRFIVQFPFPDAVSRAEIWRRVFPPETPTAGLDVDKLARLNVAGGNIRNIALNAAFLAADAGEHVGMEHLLRAAQSEYAKLEKAPTEAEIRGWV